MEAVPGDNIVFEQADGKRLMVLFGSSGITVKADQVGTTLESKEITTYSSFLFAVDKEK